jgi:hypothetical protein
MLKRIKRWEFSPGIGVAKAGVVFAKGNRTAARVQEVMTAGGNSILIVIVFIHERLDRDGENVGRANELFAKPFAGSTQWA